MFIEKFIELWSFKDRALFENSFAEGLGANGVTMIGMDERARSLRFWLLHLTIHSWKYK